jgi:hypothetical protein
MSRSSLGKQLCLSHNELCPNRLDVDITPYESWYNKKSDCLISEFLGQRSSFTYLHKTEKNFIPRHEDVYS